MPLYQGQKALASPRAFGLTKRDVSAVQQLASSQFLKYLQAIAAQHDQNPTNAQIQTPPSHRKTRQNCPRTRHDPSNSDCPQNHPETSNLNCSCKPPQPQQSTAIRAARSHELSRARPRKRSADQRYLKPNDRE